jgi:ribosomal protein L11 methyltransferase
MKKSWGELRVGIHPLLAEAAANFLVEQGSPGIIQEEFPGAAKGMRERLTAYFPANRSLRSKKEKIKKYLQSIGKDHPFQISLRIIQEEDWAEAWKVNFKTAHVTPSLVVKPPWEDYTPKKGEIVIEMDPGMAFGTGSHPSTRMCLAALEEAIPSFPYPPSLLDVGTGSGILAIAAQKMGVTAIVAVEIDTMAISYALKNARANGIDGSIDFRIGSIQRLRRVFDIVVANLLPQELLSLAAFLPKRVSPGGILIVSGLLRSQIGEIQAAFSPYELRVQNQKGSRGWACLVMGRTNPG